MLFDAKTSNGWRTVVDLHVSSQSTCEVECNQDIIAQISQADQDRPQEQDAQETSLLSASFQPQHTESVSSGREKRSATI